MTAQQSVSSQIILRSINEYIDSTFNSRSTSFYLSPNNEGENILHLSVSLSHYCEKSQLIGISIPIKIHTNCLSISLCLGERTVWRVPFSLLVQLRPPQLNREGTHWNYRIEPWMFSPESIPNMRIQLIRMIFIQIQLKKTVSCDMIQQKENKIIVHWNHEYYRLGSSRVQLLENQDQIYRSYIEIPLSFSTNKIYIPQTGHSMNGFFLQTSTPWNKIMFLINQEQTVLYEWNPDCVDCMGERKPGWRWTPIIQNCLEKFLYPNLISLIQKEATTHEEWFYWIPLSFGNDYRQWENTESSLQLNQFKQPIQILFDQPISGTIWLNAHYIFHTF